MDTYPHRKFGDRAGPDVVRPVYEGTSMPLRTISATYGVGTTTIYRWIRKYGWTRRKAAGPPPSLPPDQVRGRLSPARGEGKRLTEDRRMLKRLRRATDERLRELEGAGIGQGERTAADRERDARTLGSLFKLMEKISKLEAAAQRAAEEPAWTKEYVERKREELAQKLIAMLEQERGAPLPE